MMIGLADVGGLVRVSAVSLSSFATRLSSVLHVSGYACRESTIKISSMISPFMFG